jgi:hypothetical protein
MAVIDSEGLFKGRPIRECSATARWFGSYLFPMSNGNARIPEQRLYRSELVLAFFKLGRAIFGSQRCLISFLELHRQAAAVPAGGQTTDVRGPQWHS